MGDSNAAGHPAHAPARSYDDWLVAGGLGVTVAVSYGVLSYAFPVFIIPMGEELGWSQPIITGAFSVATVVAGFMGVVVGWWVDRFGARSIMTAGSIVAVATLLVWANVSSPAEYYVAAVMMGLAMAAVYYEPAFAVVTNRFVRNRARALTLVTVIGGFSSIVFIPFATALVEGVGWRAALVVFAVITAVVTVPIHALLLRRRPENGALPVDRDGARMPAAAGAATPGQDVAFRTAIRSRSFAWVAVGFSLAGIVSTAVAVHLIPLLLQRGHDPATAGFAMGVIGLMALPGRLALVTVGDRWSSPTVGTVLVALQVLGFCALLQGSSHLAVWLFVLLFGAGSGPLTPVRAAVLAELYGSRNYGAIGGVLSLFIALARAVAPVGASLLLMFRGSYDIVLMVLLALIATAGAAIFATGSHIRAGRCPDGPSPRSGGGPRGDPCPAVQRRIGWNLYLTHSKGG